MYRAPQVLEVLRDPSFRPELAAYAGQTKHPLTRLDKHLNTFETLNGCLMHVLQAFECAVVMEFAGSARTEEEANSAEFALALVPVDEAACDTSFLTLTNRVAGGYEKYFMRHCGRQVSRGAEANPSPNPDRGPSLFSRGAGDFGGPKNKKRKSLGPSIIISRGLPAIKGAASRWRRITEEEEEEEEPPESPLVRWVVVLSQQHIRICRCSRWTWTWMMRRRST